MKSLILLLVILNANYVLAQDFRNASWGMTKEEVKETEASIPYMENEELIGYTDILNGQEVLVGFHFENGKLVGSQYLLDNSDQSVYVDAYYDFKRALKSKYGKPAEEDILIEHGVEHLYSGKTDKFSNELVQRGFEKGHLQFYTLWETEIASINIICFQDLDTDSPFLAITYTSKSKFSKF